MYLEYVKEVVTVADAVLEVLIPIIRSPHRRKAGLVSEIVALVILYYHEREAVQRE